MPDKIFIAGASARGAAESAARAGLEVSAADLFRDRDLVACSMARRVCDYPGGIVAIAKQLSPRKWVYTGGLENSPRSVAAVSRHHTLLGNPPHILRQIRDPWRVQHVLRDAGQLFPMIRHRPPTGADRRWVRKSTKSCGGMHVRIWPDAAENTSDSSTFEADSSYFQQHVRGMSYGALYVAAQGNARFLGVTRQLSGCQWAGASGFLYVGSVGPIALDAHLVDQFQRIGQSLTAAFGLRGLFGVDTIVEGGRVWTLEVNPRFTASVEIHERATELCALSTHLQACEDAALPVAPPPNPRELHGKAIVYATCAGVLGEAFSHQIDAQNNRGQFPMFADLPHVGTKIAAGNPILTVFARGCRVSDVCRQLRAQSRVVRAALRD